MAALAQVTDFCEHALFAGVWFDVLPVWAETESEPDIPAALRAGTLVPLGVTVRPGQAVFLCSLSSRTRGDFARAASLLSPYRAIGLVDKPSCPLRRLHLLFRVVNEDFPARSTLLAPCGNEEFSQSG